MKRVSILLIPLAIMLMSGCMSSGDELPDEARRAEDIVLADPGRYSVEFENDMIRVLRIRYGPGEASVAHGHPAGCGVVIKGGTIGFTLPSGEVVSGHARPGTVNCTDAEVHSPVNLGDTETEFVFFDLKGRETFDADRDPRNRRGVTAVDGTPDALAADRSQYRREFENDDVRILRSRYPAGLSVRMHSHPARCAVYLTGGTTRVTDEAGEVQTFTRVPGEVVCTDAGVHQSENIGTTDIQAVILEMKDHDLLTR
jgi:quercetin dioxygenase-like cupin family protein